MGAAHLLGFAAYSSSLHIHHEMVYTSYFLIVLGPNPVVVYMYGVPTQDNKQADSQEASKLHVAGKVRPL